MRVDMTAPIATSVIRHGEPHQTHGERAGRFLFLY